MIIVFYLKEKNIGYSIIIVIRQDIMKQKVEMDYLNIIHRKFINYGMMDIQFLKLHR